MVVDITGNGRPPSTIYLEGKITATELKAKALSAIGLIDILDTYRIEVKDGNGKATIKITKDCIIFVSISPALDAFSENPDDPFGILNKFENMFGGKK